MKKNVNELTEELFDKAKEPFRKQAELIVSNVELIDIMQIDFADAIAVEAEAREKFLAARDEYEAKRDELQKYRVAVSEANSMLVQASQVKNGLEVELAKAKERLAQLYQEEV